MTEKLEAGLIVAAIIFCATGFGWIINTERIRGLHENTHFTLVIEPRQDLGAEAYTIVWSYDWGQFYAIGEMGDEIWFNPTNINKTYINRFSNSEPVTIKYKINYYRNTTSGDSWYWENILRSEWNSQKFFPMRK